MRVKICDNILSKTLNSCLCYSFDNCKSEVQLDEIEHTLLEFILLYCNGTLKYEMLIRLKIVLLLYQN